MPMSSSAHPVSAIAPLTPVMPSCGVSKLPNGALAPPGATIAMCTVTVGDACAPVAVTVTVPVAVAAGRPLDAMPTVKLPLPVPDPFVTWIHGASAVATQVTVPAPDCTRRTDWLDVTDVAAPPDAIAPKLSDDGPAVSVGR